VGEGDIVPHRKVDMGKGEKGKKKKKKKENFLDYFLTLDIYGRTIYACRTRRKRGEREKKGTSPLSLGHILCPVGTSRGR